jgi:hypothetical protein
MYFVNFKIFSIPMTIPQETRNQYVVSCYDYIAIGAAAALGTNALRLDGDLRFCSSGPSDTFQNPCLAPEEDLYPAITDTTPKESLGEVTEIIQSVGNPFPVGDIEIFHVPTAIRGVRSRKLR